MLTRPVIENSKKTAKKLKKLENTIIASFQAKIGQERLRKREKKKIVLMYSYLTRNRKFQKNSKKIQKIIKYCYGFISSQNKGGNAEKREKIKSIFLFRSNLTRNRKFQKNLKNTIVASFEAKIG